MKHYKFPGTYNYPNYEIVGTEHHGESILRVIGGQPQQGEYYSSDSHEAELVPEPDNPYDPNAISIRIKGWLVGYMSRADAEEYAPVLHRIAASGYQARTRARIAVSGPHPWQDDRPDSKLDGNVTIALPPARHIAPINDSFPKNVALLPWGRAAQVQGEEHHLDHLFNYVPPGGEGLIITTLHRAVHQLKNGTEKEYVEVRVDGERAGQLSPTVSAQFLPAVRHAEDMDKRLGSWAKLEGSALAVEIKVQGARASDVPDWWLNKMPSPPALVPIATSYDVPPTYETDRYSQEPNSKPSPGRKPAREQRSTKVESPSSGTSDANDKPSSDETKKASGGCCGCLTLIVLLVIIAVLFL